MKNIRITSKLLTLCFLTSLFTAGLTSYADEILLDTWDNNTEKAYEYFCELSKIPRCTYNEKAISDWIVAFGKERGLETIQDENLNVLIKKPGSKGREDEPPVILQGHMDMVCEKSQDSTHNFLTDPIIPIIENDFVIAQNKTTLGADNGGGVAFILAVLDADDLSHPPIEAIITTSEETSMTGASTFDVSLLKGKRFINVDSEGDDAFTVSSASADIVDILIPVENMALPDGLASYTLTVKGLTGGHSGLEIHKELANANILLAQLLEMLNNTHDVEILVTSINGGSYHNAIPRESTAVISFENTYLETIQSIIKQAETVYKSEYPAEKNLSIILEEIETPQTIIQSESLQRVLDGILSIPNGVLSMSPDIPELVQTSNNVGVVITDEKTVILWNYPRSSIVSEQLETLDTLQSIADSIGAQAEITHVTPPWPYKQESPLRDKMIEIYVDMYGKEPQIKALNAGLECAIFADKMPEADLIAMGMYIYGAHTTEERLSLSSFNTSFDFLVRVLEEI